MSQAGETRSSTNWFQAPLAADAALTEPLKRALAGRDAQRAAVRSLMLRRCLGPKELTALQLGRQGVLDVVEAFSRLEAELPSPGAPRPGPAAPAPADRPKTGLLSALTGRVPAGEKPRPAADIAPNTLRIMVRAMASVVKTSASLETLADGDAVARSLGLGIARTLADEVFPPMPSPDPNALHRAVVAGILGARPLEIDDLAELGQMDREVVARRLEERMDLMLAVVPPGRALKLGRVVRTACEWLRRSPPAEAEAIARALGAS